MNPTVQAPQQRCRFKRSQATTIHALGILLWLLSASCVAAANPELIRIQSVLLDQGAVFGTNGSQGMVVSPDGQYVYVTGSFDNAIAVLKRRQDGGRLNLVDAVFDSDAGVDGLEGARGIAISSDGNHVYVASATDNAVAVFSRSVANGELTFIEALFDDAGGGMALVGAHGITLSPDGDHVYVVSRGDDSITAFTRNTSTGELNLVEFEVEGLGGVTGMDGAEGLTVSPDGAFVYVASEVSNSVAVFERDSKTGELVFVEAEFDGINGVVGLSGGNSIVVSPDGNHIYAAGEFDNGALGDDDLGAAFSRNKATGELTFLAEIPAFVDSLGDVQCLGVSGGGGIAVNSIGDRIYVTESLQSALLVFARSQVDGALDLVESHCNFVAGQRNVNQVAVSPDDLNIYTTGLAGNIIVYGPGDELILATGFERSAGYQSPNQQYSDRRKERRR